MSAEKRPAPSASGAADTPGPMPQAPSPEPSTPTLTVVVSSHQAWPKLEAICASLLAQAKRCRAEVILAVAGEECLPPIRSDAETDGVAGVRATVLAGANVFELRAHGLSLARGTIVAFLEDHNLVPPSWCEELLRHYRAHPECESLVCAVVNGSEETRTDRANFIHTFGDLLPALAEEPMQRVPSIAGSSLRRTALDPAARSAGYVELVGFAQVFGRGKTHYLGSCPVVHTQPNRFGRTFMNHFHNGRACAGLLLRLKGGRGRWRAVATSCLLPAAFLRSWLFGRQRRVLRLGYCDCLPQVLCLSLAHSLGRLTGSLVGPGRSPWKAE